MSDKMFVRIVSAVLFIIPVVVIMAGYLMLYSHLQGMTAAILGWVLFLSGWLVVLPFCAAGIAEITAKPEPRRY